MNGINISKFEAFGIGGSIVAMVLALFLLRLDAAVFTSEGAAADDQEAAVVVASDAPNSAALADAIVDASRGGSLDRLIIDDIVVGDGEIVEEGDTVAVRYIGTLQNGQQFDNNYLQEAPFEFTVGDGRVIKGWERGVVGMKEGGQRILVVPPELGYGKEGYGPIPGGATLVFAVELIEVK